MQRFVLRTAFATLIAFASGGVARAEIPPATGSAFLDSVELEAGLSTEAVVAADVDRDGNVDLIAANNETTDVSVLFGNGDGTFEPTVNFAAASGPAAVRVADMNGDGLPDIVVAHDSASVVAVLIQGPARQFALGDSTETGGGPEDLAVADFDRDGNFDAATANFFDVIGTVSVRFGRGDGTFFLGLCDGAPTRCDTSADCEAPATCVPVELDVLPPDSLLFASPRAIAAVDVDGDNDLDLVAANVDADNVAVLRGAGDGTFAPVENFPAGAAPVGLTVVDVNIDGRLDLVTADSDDDTVSILLGEEGGGFQSPTSIAVGSFPEAVAAGDFNLDGRPDIAVTNIVDIDDGISILRGNGDGTFQAEIEDFPIGGITAAGLAIKDVNGDRKQDMVTANLDSPDVSEALSLLLNDGNLTPGDANADGELSAGDVETALMELFDGDGSTVITVGGGSTEAGPGVDGNGDETVSAADILGVIGLVFSGQG